MRFENYRIRLYYKLNKLQKGKWGKENNYIYFFGEEIPSFASMDGSSEKIYEGDTVIYKNSNKPNHPNNGLKASCYGAQTIKNGRKNKSVGKK